MHSGLHKLSMWAAYGGTQCPEWSVPAGALLPHVVTKVGGQYANQIPAQPPRTGVPPGGHAINGMHPIDRLCQPMRTPRGLLTGPDLT